MTVYFVNPSLTVYFEGWQLCTVTLNEFIIYFIIPNKMWFLFKFNIFNNVL